MVRELRKRDLAPDHCRVHIVAKAQAVSLRMKQTPHRFVYFGLKTCSRKLPLLRV